ncbi:MAG: hypothetical protein EAX81_04950 [Candidatus Thorarchaeota archaeon]|nr:hypothetical protein [Candidatus Thorarchaeota archaeon]
MDEQLSPIKATITGDLLLWPNRQENRSPVISHATPDRGCQRWAGQLERFANVYAWSEADGTDLGVR